MKNTRGLTWAGEPIGRIVGEISKCRKCEFDELAGCWEVGWKKVDLTGTKSDGNPFKMHLNQGSRHLQGVKLVANPIERVSMVQKTCAHLLEACWTAGKSTKSMSGGS